MEYGLIGEHLPHSFSKEIHEMLGRYPYELKELTPAEVAGFMEERNFRGINVTIPYKQTVIPYLYEMTSGAAAIGAVNTIVNRDGRLYGDNTDFYGMSSMLRRAGIALKGKRVLILGTGGTSLTARAVCLAERACRVERVSRRGADHPETADPADPVISYSAARAFRGDTEIIINTTPVGMFPNPEAEPIDIDAFPLLEGAADAIYNPLKTRWIQKAEARGLKASCGLFMLTAQAMRAAENFTGQSVPEEKTESIYRSLLKQKRNIVLIGMPGSGKTTVGNVLKERMGRELLDTDEKIVMKAGCPITEIFAGQGEKTFRDMESDVISECSRLSGKIISTGGGAVLREENVRILKQNGILFFLDRPLDDLLPTDDRPLANSADKIRDLYVRRHSIYEKAADVRITDFSSAEETASLLMRIFNGLEE